jgi:hypothetical protein
MRALPELFVLGSLLLAGCASRTEWTTWREHPTHFASGNHLEFSIKNTENVEDTAPRVTRHDLARARQEGWWGELVAVSEKQILER